MQFTKAHATGNDFVMITDAAGQQDLDAEFVAAVCDRRMGVGADGLIRAVPAHHVSEGAALLRERGLSSTDDQPLWFMDYRNSDGSIAEMCGNGVRAFAHYLLAEGLTELGDGAQLTIGTRAGVKTVRTVQEGYAIGMGVWSFIDPELAQANASDSLVQARGLTDPRPALSISMGNPHTVVALPDEATLQALDLHQAPQVDPQPPYGTNVEFVVPSEPLVENGVGRVRMRVHERGVGETLSCGTGACAAAAAVRVWAAGDGVNTWRVGVPGGEVTVRFTPREDGAEEVELAGPAVLVYTGTLV
ncbi:diaminopimelate epimerase [Nesterenkonia flava]|uniref:Diaminopimelate epimerase n=1 Tax=Nesterenkonia flava TaxID=469799 RepID=A0ABU1FTQ7_9MICC|nr:diaminopimelate epimerase [Nesterenkonia flava]MDR5711622.1 diaminopimelate epimerase [Nesterenkonia flava]